MNPMAALARELTGRGHRATFVGIADIAALAEGAGFAFQPVGLRSHPAGRLAGWLGRLASVRGLWGVGGIVRDMAEMTDMLCRELPDALRSLGVDGVVCDQTEAAGGLVADHLGLPCVSVANALPLNREPLVPPPFTGWRYDPSAWGRERNLGGYRVSDRLMAAHRAVIAEHAARWRLGPRVGLEACVSRLAEISQTVDSFDFPRSELPATFHHVGPLRSGSLVPGFSLPAGDGRPLAYASLGTLQGSRARLFRTIAKATERGGRRLVLAHGGRLAPEDAVRLPGRPAVFGFVDQPTVLAAAEVAVLNGGLNTVLDALAAGVPAVVVPIAFEQGAIAARLTRAGAGIGVSRRFLSARRLGRAIDRVATEPPFRDAAARLRSEIAASGGVGRAAEVVEAVLATGKPVGRDMGCPSPSTLARVA